MLSDDLFAHLDSDPLHEEEHSQSFTGRFADAATALRYMLAGHATVTLRSAKTGARFTYKLAKLKKATSGPRGIPIFVGLLRGADNESDYEFLGTIFEGQGVFWHGKKSRIAENAPSAKAFSWSFRQLAKGELPPDLEIWHEGSCGRCGRKLTVPESIESGFGPECRGKIGGG